MLPPTHRLKRAEGRCVLGGRRPTALKPIRARNRLARRAFLPLSPGSQRAARALCLRNCDGADARQSGAATARGSRGKGQENERAETNGSRGDSEAHGARAVPLMVPHLCRRNSDSKVHSKYCRVMTRARYGVASRGTSRSGVLLILSPSATFPLKHRRLTSARGTAGAYVAHSAGLGSGNIAMQYHPPTHRASFGRTIRRRANRDGFPWFSRGARTGTTCSAGRRECAAANGNVRGLQATGHSATASAAERAQASFKNLDRTAVKSAPMRGPSTIAFDADDTLWHWSGVQADRGALRAALLARLRRESEGLSTALLEPRSATSNITVRPEGLRPR